MFISCGKLLAGGDGSRSQPVALNRRRKQDGHVSGAGLSQAKRVPTVAKNNL